MSQLNLREIELLRRMYQSSNLNTPKRCDIPTLYDIKEALETIKINKKEIHKDLVQKIMSFVDYYYIFNNEKELKRVLKWLKKNGLKNSSKIDEFQRLNLVQNYVSFDTSYLLERVLKMWNTRDDRNEYLQDQEYNPGGNYLYHRQIAYSPVEFTAEPTEYVKYQLEFGCISERAVIFHRMFILSIYFTFFPNFKF